MNSPESELGILYGRRRVGKTRLLRQAMANRHGAFFVADLGSSTEQLSLLTERLAAATNDPMLRTPLPSWDALFHYVMSRAESGPFALVLDEFPYLCTAYPPLASVLTRIWDERHRAARLKLFLSGSSVGFMESEVLAARSPLFGRRTGQLRLESMHLWEAAGFFPRYSPHQIAKIYGLVGGMPAYLRLFREAEVHETLQVHAFSRTGFLYDEARFLLMQELRDPRLYLAVMRAIAGGRTTHNEIVQATGLDSRAVASYLEPLRVLGLVEREVPVTEFDAQKSRKGRYRIRDNFFRFAMRFIEPHRSELEGGNVGAVMARLAAQMDDFLSLPFEQSCLDWIRAANARGKLPFRAERIGRWWSPNGEIDVCALGSRAALFGECKWSTRPVGQDILRDLEKRAQAPVFSDYPQRRFALFSRSGFTPQLTREAAAKEVLLITPTELVQGP